MMKLHKAWHALLEEEIQKPYIKKLKDFLLAEKGSGAVIYPKEEDVFKAFSFFPPEKVKIVIVGQDPYHGPGQAHGLSFSVPEGVRAPPSLQNIYKEIEQDLSIPPSSSGCLIPWAKQGVLLLNATLTVKARSPKSHYGMGWEAFTDAVIQKLAERKEPLVFMLWGKSAMEKCAHLLEKSHHLVLTAPHPSPYSAHSGFFGCKHFSRANEALEKWGLGPIDWTV